MGNLPSQQIGALFSELYQTNNLEVALSRCVRLACEVAGSPAGALAGNADQAPTESWWIRHDPHSLLHTIVSGADAAVIEADSGADRSSMYGAGADENAGENAGMHLLRLALGCGGGSVGELLLVAPHSTTEARTRARIAPLDTVLATLMAATAGIHSVDGLLAYPAFRERVASEIARGIRHSESFCVLQMRFPRTAAQPAGGADSGRPVAHAVGKSLVSRLRKGDVVGRIGSDQVAILLPATTALGARIAQHRIQHMLPHLIGETSGSGIDFAVPEFSTRCFPEDAADVDGLCPVQEQGAENGSREPMVGVAR